MRTEPRSFKFKSRHLPEALPEWEERKRRVEEDVFGASQDAPRPIRFRQGGKSSEGRAARRAASVRASRMAALRARLAVRRAAAEAARRARDAVGGPVPA
ncbi:MAG: hypothetical protein ACPIA5_03605 [Flavobacteriales bacterium]